MASSKGALLALSLSSAWAQVVRVQHSLLKADPSDPAFAYEGRWADAVGLLPVDAGWADAGGPVYADWPCSSVKFQATVGAADEETSLELAWYGLRTRVNITARDEAGSVVFTTLDSGPSISPLFKRSRKVTVKFGAPGVYAVSLRKLTTAAPFGTGLGGTVLSPSVLEFHGISGTTGSVELSPPAPADRRIEFIGASDTAGYCVDGTPDMSDITAHLTGWEYENCDSGYVGQLGRSLGADISVQGIAGTGLVQNAQASQTWQLGKFTMPDYFTRTIQTNESSSYEFPKPWPNLVMISLGGNDFNHQNGNVPSNETFAAKYEEFLNTVIHVYWGRLGPGPKVVAVCGMGDPQEQARDPDNDRCSPCPHVQDAVNAFNSKYGDGRVGYVFIPCDGSVATGTDDIGCDGHKNQKGQQEVAAFLEPQVRTIMGWS